MTKKSKFPDLTWLDEFLAADLGHVFIAKGAKPGSGDGAKTIDVDVESLREAWAKNSGPTWGGYGPAPVKFGDPAAILSDVGALRAAWAKGDEESLRPVVEALKGNGLGFGPKKSRSAGLKK